MLVNQIDGYKEMGVVNAANQIFYALLFIPGVMASYTIPVLSERWACGDRVACRKILKSIISINAAIVFPLVIGGCIVNKYIMGLYGASFMENGNAAVAAMLTAGVLAVQMPIGQMTAATGKMWIEIGMNLSWAILFIAGTWVSLSDGAVGLLAARLIAYIMHTIWTTGFAYWLLRKPCSI